MLYLPVLELCCFEWFQNIFQGIENEYEVLELCCFEWFQNTSEPPLWNDMVLELCCFEWFQNKQTPTNVRMVVLELCCFEWFQNVWYLGLSRNSILRNVLNFSENAFQYFSKVFFYGKIKTEFI